MRLTKALILVLLTSIITSSNASAMDLERIRSNYEKAVSDKKVCKLMMEELSKDIDSTLQLAYLGGFQAIWASHVLNPFSKLSTFNTGKNNIETAIKRAPKNTEIRFIRLSIQKNSPSFLGYRDNMVEDKNFIQANHKSISSICLKTMIAALI